MSAQRERPDKAAGAGGADELIEKLGVRVDPELFVLALTHRSFAHEAGGIPTNERLEFLGDSVLGFVVTDALYRDHADLPEGELAKMRAATVSQRSLAAIARELGLGRFILLGKGELGTRGYDKDSILSDTVEAIIGAVYLSGGIDAARTFVHRLVDATLEIAADLGAALDWKTSLQELAGELGLGAPEYRWEAEGPAHARIFTSHVALDGEILGAGTGTAKKHAEQEAAEHAYAVLRSRVDAAKKGSDASDGADAGRA